MERKLCGFSSNNNFKISISWIFDVEENSHIIDYYSKKKMIKIGLLVTVDKKIMQAF